MLVRPSKCDLDVLNISQLALRRIRVANSTDCCCC